jgi:hypothetical protein
MVLEESGLARTRPDAVRIQFARLRGYAECLETIKAHGYDLARDHGGALHAGVAARRGIDEADTGGAAPARRPCRAVVGVA